MRLTSAGIWGLALAAVLASPTSVEAGDWSIGSRGVRYRTADRNFDIRLRGRLHLDGATFDDDETNFNSDIEIRRLRPSLQVRLFRDWRFRADVELSPESDEDAPMRQLGIAYTGFKNTRIRVGNQTARVGLEEAISSNDLTFMERSLASSISPSFLTGFEVQTHGGLGEVMSSASWNFSFGVYMEPLGRAQSDRHRTEAVSYVGRLTFAPFSKDERILHVGISGQYRDLDGDSRFRLRTRPESGIASRLLNTGFLRGVRKTGTLGLEAAGVYGPFSFQGEYLRMGLLRRTRPNPDFEGGYLQASWFPTGESRLYAKSRGAFRTIRPKRKWGALQLAVRWSTLDLNDETVTGGNETNWTLGANWYINRNVRLMFNYVNVDANRSDGLNEKPHIFQGRFQLVF